MIKLIFFDSDGVLINRKREGRFLRLRLSKFLKRNGVNWELSDRIWHKVIIKRIRREGLTMAKARKEFLSLAGMDKDLITEYNHIVKSSMRFTRLSDRSEKKVLQKLKSRGMRIAVLSDTVLGSRELNEIYKNLGISGFIDKTFVSKEIGYKKPHRKAYMTVLKHFGVAPSEAVFVSHVKDELQGARRLKIRTVSYRGDLYGDFAARNFSDIARIVQNLA